MTAAEWIIRLACRLLAPRLEDWGEAMAQEAASIQRPGAALVFAVGCGAWVVRHALGHALRSALTPTDIDTAHATTPRTLWRSRDAALICAIAAAGLGLVFLSETGAPTQYLILNATALIAALIVVLPFRGNDPVEAPFVGVVAIAVGLTLLLTAVFGEEASGARRWLSLGGVVVQPGLIGLPFLLVGFAASRDILTTTGLILGAIAIGLQPDHAMAGAMTTAVGVVALMRRDLPALAMLPVALACSIVTALRSDEVSAAPFVIGVFRTASATSSIAGLAVWGGIALLLLPAVLGVWRSRETAAAHATFGATWLALIAAGFFGDYPTPVIAYGGSAIVGYVLSTLALPRGGFQSVPRASAITSQSLMMIGHETDGSNHSSLINVLRRSTPFSPRLGAQIDQAESSSYQRF